MSFRASFLAGISALALVACTATHHKIDLPRDQVAEVLGLEEYSWLGMGHRLSFEAIDGKALGSGPFASLPTTIDLMPGKHTLRCYVVTTFDGLRGPSGSVDVELEARAGAAYQARYIRVARRDEREVHRADEGTDRGRPSEGEAGREGGRQQRRLGRRASR